jgi:hypothetical protein
VNGKVGLKACIIDEYLKKNANKQARDHKKCGTSLKRKSLNLIE